MGAEVEHYIPNRHTEGYGINCEALDKLKEDGYSLVVSVDCGIRSREEADHAREIGLDMIITDHHEPGNQIPDAFTVICPKQPGDEYPFKEFSGVGIAYKLAQALLERSPIEGTHAVEWLDLVAVGTVADVVPLTGENRVLVRYGLSMLTRRQRQGLRSLMGAAGIEDGKKINAYHIGYVIGPRLNASGRMETAEASYQILMTEDLQEAGKLAQLLDDQNKQRQDVTRDIQQAAEEMVSGEDRLVFAVSPDFQLGVVGLAASRLVETFYRPAVVGINEGETTRASCRSIPEFHITNALDEVAYLLERHGGHAMAAGFTVRNENLLVLEQELKRIATERLAGLELRPTLRADMELPLAEVKPYILEYQDAIEPTGAGNPSVRFICRNLRVTQKKKIGKDQSHLRLTVTDGRVVYDGIAFRQADWADKMPERIDILFSFEVNIYNGRTSLQLNVQDIRPSGINPQTDI
jgi:single-stranded-DNA-specific exonuclease